MEIRLMRAGDLEAVQRVQRVCYPSDYHESSESFGNKLEQAPDTCWVLEAGGQVEAYLVCLPASDHSLPGLHDAQWCAPPQPSLLYLHDLAVSPTLRGSGAAQALIDRARARAREAGLSRLALVAVQGSAGFWQRHGFETTRPEQADKLRSFGESAQFMTCTR